MLQLFSKRVKKPDPFHQTTGGKSMRTLPPLPNPAYSRVAHPMDTLSSEEGNDVVYSRLKSGQSSQGSESKPKYAEARDADETDFDDAASSIYCRLNEKATSVQSTGEGPLYDRAAKAEEPIYTRIVKNRGAT
eukprot:m.111767 g.111767  ORF g.111767 m.111767 type:complete len:133 (+) comp12946_c0_seq1:1568-1966(+)